MDWHVLQSHATSACKPRRVAGDHSFYGAAAFGSPGGMLSLYLRHIGPFCFACSLGSSDPFTVCSSSTTARWAKPDTKTHRPTKWGVSGVLVQKKKDTVGQRRGTVIQVQSFGGSGVVGVLCNFRETEAPGGWQTGRRGRVGAGHETKKVSPRAVARRSSAAMCRKAVARPNGQKRQRESYNRAPQVRGIAKRKQSKLDKEMCPLGCVLTAPVPLPVLAPLAAVPTPKLVPATPTAKGAKGADWGVAKRHIAG